jgi:DNA-binding NtrC family response regulator
MKDTFAHLVDHLMNGGFTLEESKGILEMTMVERAMERCDGNQSEASKLLGIHRNTLGARMKEYALAKRKTVQSVRRPVRRKASA